ncbi:MAG: PDZ domain-containing protein [Planctomycetes bacterium]|nr:PDZ domain-containing protein [Planctomycetota bacterium]
MNERVFYGVVGGLVLCGVVGILVALAGSGQGPSVEPLPGPSVEVLPAGSRGTPPGSTASPSDRRALDAARLEIEALQAEVASLRDAKRDLEARSAGLEASERSLRARVADLEARLNAAPPVPSPSPFPRQPTGLAYLGVSSLDEGGGGGIAVETMEGCPAYVAGMRSGDRIFSMDGRPIRSVADIQEVVRSHQPGDPVEVRFRRGEVEAVLTVRLGTR